MDSKRRRTVKSASTRLCDVVDTCETPEPFRLIAHKFGNRSRILM